MPIADSKIIISPVLPGDFLTIARLEAAAFADDDFSAVAFGTQRSSDEALASRAASFGAEPKPGESIRNMKAVALGFGGEEIVGFASWTFRIGRRGTDGDMRRAEETKAGDEKEKEGEKNTLGPGANMKFFEDSILKGDEHMERSTEGRDYAKLGILVVSPQHQRKGIGALLLEDGLREADIQGLQAVLGASPEGIRLYRKYGFVDFEVMDLNLWEYEGGEGMGVARHVIMHRPSILVPEPR